MVYLAEASNGLWIALAVGAGALIGAAALLIGSKLRATTALSQAKRIIADAKEEADRTRRAADISSKEEPVSSSAAACSPAPWAKDWLAAETWTAAVRVCSAFWCRLST